MATTVPARGGPGVETFVTAPGAGADRQRMPTAAKALRWAGAGRSGNCPAFVILDGTLLPIGRIAADTPYHSGKHECHRTNVQVLIGRLLWV